MANTIALRKQYSTLLDEVYKLSSLTAVLDGPNELVKEGANANEILIPKLSMQECEEMASEKMLVGRHKRVAFMDADGSGKTFTRMTGFTSLSDGKNSTEYSRQYVDEASERSDVVGYAPAIDYEFDRYTNDPVHEKIAAITDDEILGTEAQVDIAVVDLFEQKTSETTCTARKRTWSVIPDTEGDGTDALIYKGSFKAAGEITKGTATTTDGWKTCTFTAGGE